MTFFEPSTALYFRNILLYIHHYVPQLILSAPNDMVQLVKRVTRIIFSYVGLYSYSFF